LHGASTTAEFQIVEAADGLEAVWKAEEVQPNVILLDINLPKLDGFEVAKEVRALAPRARLLFMSQESSPDVVRRALDLGAHGYVHKVSAGTDLLPAIDAALAGQRFVSRSVAFTEPADAPVPRRHEIVFCTNEAGVVDCLSRFIATALNAADAAIALATTPHRTRLLRELRTRDVDIDGAIERGTYVSFDADDAPDRSDSSRRSTLCVRPPPKPGKPVPAVAFCGERAGRLWAAGRIVGGGGARTILRRTRLTTSTFCARIRCRTRKTTRRSRACAADTPLLLPAATSETWGSCD
jgi:DNA-binding response OmpR family regulator